MRPLLLPYLVLLRMRWRSSFAKLLFPLLTERIPRPR